MRNTFVLILAFLLFGCGNNSVGKSGTEVGNGFIAGIVLDTAGQPLADASITLLTDEVLPSVSRTLKSDSTGYFSIEIEDDSTFGLLIESGTSALFQKAVTPQPNPELIDTFATKTKAVLKLQIKDSQNPLQAPFHLSHTGITSEPGSVQVDDSTREYTFQCAPASFDANIVQEQFDETAHIAGPFSIQSGATQEVYTDFYWRSVDCPLEEAVSISVASDTLWWSSQSTIVGLHDADTIFSYSSDGDFPFANITTTTIDHVGSFWLGNENGNLGFVVLPYESPKNIGVLSQQEQEEPLLSIVVAKDTAYWSVAESGKLLRHSGLGEKFSIDSIPFQKILSDGDNGVWALSKLNELYHISFSETSFQVEKIVGLPIEKIVAITEGSNGSCWILQESNITEVLKDYTTKSINLSEHPTNTFTHIAFNNKGVWLSATSELTLYQSGQFQKVNNSKAPFGAYEIKGIHSDGGDILWLITQGTLFQLY